MKHLLCILMLVGLTLPAVAQDPSAELPLDPDPIELLPTAVPPELELVDYTMAIYDIILSHRFPRDRDGERDPEKFPNSCKSLASKIEDYLDANESAIEEAADNLEEVARGLSNEEVDVLGERLRKRLSSEHSKLRKGQKILYGCLHAAANQGSPRRPLTKQMKRFHRMQAAALQALIRIPKSKK